MKVNSTQKNNPFSITFGREPSEEIERETIIEEIVGDFTAEVPSQQVVLLTGVRGSGKSSLTAKVMKMIGQITATEERIVRRFLYQQEIRSH